MTVLSRNEPLTEALFVGTSILLETTIPGRFERAANPRYYGVIEEYAKLTGALVILDTSFNRKQPIVARPKRPSLVSAH
jgi:hypothetical protein